MRQDGGVGENDDEDDVAKDSHHSNDRVNTTVEHIVNDVVSRVVHHSICHLGQR